MQTIMNCLSTPNAKPTDVEWVRYALSIMIMAASIFTSHYVLYFGIFRPASILTAPNVTDPRPSAYAFWLVGNTSFFSPGIMNRTDMNASSPTYGYWVPPPGACITLNVALTREIVKPTFLLTACCGSVA